MQQKTSSDYLRVFFPLIYSYIEYVIELVFIHNRYVNLNPIKRISRDVYHTKVYLSTRICCCLFSLSLYLSVKPVMEFKRANQIHTELKESKCETITGLILSKLYMSQIKKALNSCCIIPFSFLVHIYEKLVRNFDLICITKLLKVFKATVPPHCCTIIANTKKRGNIYKLYRFTSSVIASQIRNTWSPLSLREHQEIYNLYF